MLLTDAALSLDQHTSLAILMKMLLIRRFEEKVMELVAAGHKLGTVHVYIGQEGTGAAVLQAAGPQDLLFTNHRNHGHVIGRGVDPGRAFAEMLGRTTGLQGGRAGGQHLADPGHGLLHTSGIVGGAISLAVGAAYALKRAGQDRIAIAFFGDSVLEEGVAYEALNLAAMWKLPIIFVCENNSIEAQGLANKGYPTLVHAAQNLSLVPESLGITTHRITNGGNASEIYAAATAARLACRNGRGPVFLEALTVRWPGSQTLAPKSAAATDIRIALGESAAEGPDRNWVNQHDPLLRWIRELMHRGFLDRDELFSMNASILERVSIAAQFAENSPFADPATASDRIFS